MTRTRIGLGLATGMMLWFSGVPAVGQYDSSQDFAAFTAEPGAERERLKKDVGTWNATMKMYMGGPDAEPMVVEGVETNRLFGGGLWLVSDFESEFFGQKFNGHGQTGYDSKKGKYVGTWIDSMTDHLGLLEGTFDEKDDAFIMFLATVDPATGKPVKEKHVHMYLDDDTREYTLTVPGPDGKDVKTMEVRYKRRKG